jgi:hypothetical protein
MRQIDSPLLALRAAASGDQTPAAFLSPFKQQAAAIMAATMMSSKSLLAGAPLQAARPSAQRPAARSGVVVRAADRPLFIPGAQPPEYLDGTLAGAAWAVCHGSPLQPAFLS